MNNEAENSERYWRTVAAQLAARADVPAPLQKMVNALANVTDTTMTHAEVLEFLPVYIAAELDGFDIRTLYPQVKYHLDHCESCEAEYAELLTFEMEFAAEERGQVVSVPVPVLETAPQEALRVYVQQVAQKIAEVVFEEISSRVQRAANVLFQQIQQSGGGSFLLNPQPTLGEEVTPITLVSTVYVATERLVQGLDPALLANPATLRSLLRKIALEEANRQGIQPEEAEAFADAFAQSVAGSQLRQLQSR
jgi:hypothetical protein